MRPRRKMAYSPLPLRNHLPQHLSLSCRKHMDFRAEWRSNTFSAACDWLLVVDSTAHNCWVAPSWLVAFKSEKCFIKTTLNAKSCAGNERQKKNRWDEPFSLQSWVYNPSTNLARRKDQMEENFILCQRFRVENFSFFFLVFRRLILREAFPQTPCVLCTEH